MPRADATGPIASAIIASCAKFGEVNFALKMAPLSLFLSLSLSCPSRMQITRENARVSREKARARFTFARVLLTEIPFNPSKILSACKTKRAPAFTRSARSLARSLVRRRQRRAFSTRPDYVHSTNSARSCELVYELN